jgi:gamma-butyrobetaine dioxygenase
MRVSSLLRSAVRLDRDGLSFTMNGKQKLPRHLPYRWLRDACQCPSCVHPTTRQKLFETSDVPIDIQPSPISDSVSLQLNGASQGLRVNWSDGHGSYYPLGFLQSYTTNSTRDTMHHEDVVKPVLWDLQAVRTSPSLWMEYASLSNPGGKVAAYTQLARYGVLFVRGVPNEQTSDELCELRRLAGLFGEIRPSFYGSVWDVRSVPESRNIAYTDLNLGLHIDLL